MAMAKWFRVGGAGFLLALFVVGDVVLHLVELEHVEPDAVKAGWEPQPGLEIRVADEIAVTDSVTVTLT